MPSIAKEAIIQSIALRIQDSLIHKKQLDISLLGGDFGKLCFLMYSVNAQLLDPNPTRQIFTRLLTNLKSQRSMASYCNGLSGLCLGLELLELDGVLRNVAVATSECHNSLIRALNIQLESNLDFLHGATGIALYLVRHAMHNRCILEAMKNLILRWHSEWDSIHGNMKKKFNYLNLSLSHGLSSMVILVSRIYNSTDDICIRQIAYKLLEYWGSLIINSLVDPNHIGCFTPIIKRCIGNDHIYKTRLAWCYGDIGTYLALKSIFNITGKIHFKIISENIIKHILIKRMNLYHNFIYDAGLCHGVSGIFQFLKSQSISQSTVMDYWKNELRRKLIIEKGNYYFGKFDIKQNTIIKCDNLLEGDAGVGLVLLGANRFLNTILLFEE